ncbi:MAG TPA: hypothetical protein EYO92_07570, partial [Candidatus Marinimicrobia bacterium]|nr:hypothetical protein [Candidatus Neomarinimicrobiota bacterium]
MELQSEKKLMIAEYGWRLRRRPAYVNTIVPSFHYCRQAADRDFPIRPDIGTGFHFVQLHSRDKRLVPSDRKQRTPSCDGVTTRSGGGTR